MSTLLRTMTGLSLAALTSLSPIAALAAPSSPLGVFQTTDRKMDFTAALCGSDMKHLCVTLSGARGSAVTKYTKMYLGKYVVDHAKPVGANTWQGSMTVQGYTGTGTLVLNPGVNFVMHGCVYVVACQDFTLIPAKK